MHDRYAPDRQTAERQRTTDQPGGRQTIARGERQAGQPWYEDAPLGEGDVDIRGFLLKLHDLGYEGPLTIEREYSPNQVGDIKKALQLLEDLRKEIRG